jgi:hypothetical protein
MDLEGLLSTCRRHGYTLAAARWSDSGALTAVDLGPARAPEETSPKVDSALERKRAHYCNQLNVDALSDEDLARLP